MQNFTRKFIRSKSSKSLFFCRQFEEWWGNQPAKRKKRSAKNSKLDLTSNFHLIFILRSLYVSKYVINNHFRTVERVYEREVQN